ncbi:hypothetical protein MUA04_08320 [Enterobacteriaceae bacterium H11S18]|nr:hypothetical protein [Dryocola clanedunensis]MCT4705012.1 hypothetical protein [Dryocola clanedunensis]MCT4710192.1 hypothetical protein [Dryocola clanedunensis]
MAKLTADDALLIRPTLKIGRVGKRRRHLPQLSVVGWISVSVIHRKYQ